MGQKLVQLDLELELIKVGNLLGMQAKKILLNTSKKTIISELLLRKNTTTLQFQASTLKEQQQKLL